MRILDATGAVVANYTYDAWGKVTNSGNIIGLYNPIRYRGYYYDTDTGFYYLQSRYYDPTIKRFISASGDVLDYNMYVYCSNSPIYCKQNSINYGTSITNFSVSMSKSNYSSISTEIKNSTSLSNPSQVSWLGNEHRTSTGWDSSPNFIDTFLFRIGFSSYNTYTEGTSGVFYSFYGSTVDMMNWNGVTHYAGLGMNLFNVIGLEIQLEKVGITHQVSIGSLSISLQRNLIGSHSLTIGVNTDSGNGNTQTTAFTIAVNTGFLLATVIMVCKVATTGDVSLVPGLTPSPIFIG